MDDDEKRVLTPTEARQASPERSTLYVLIIALSILAVVAALLYAYFYSRDLPRIS